MEKNKKNRAQAMVVVFVYISVVSLMGIYLMMYAANLHSIVVREINHTRAFYAAEAGLIRTLARHGSGGSFTVPIPDASGKVMTVDVFSTATGISGTYREIKARVSNWRK
jgi:hypothetical protein